MITQISTSNTFGQWLAATQSLILLENNLTNGNGNTVIANTNFEISGINSKLTVNTRAILANIEFRSNVITLTDSTTIRSNTEFTSNTLGQTIFDKANLAYDLANTANISIESTYNHANAAYGKANNSGIVAQAAFDAANATATTETIDTIWGTSNAAFNKANSANVLAQAAFNKANTDYTGITVSTASYGNATHVPIIKLESNGRVSLVTNTILSGITITNDETTNGDRYILMGTDVSGDRRNINVSYQKLYFNPNTGVLNSTTFNSLSDINYKNSVLKIPNALDYVLKLDGVSFYYNESGMKSYGLIAQEVEKIIPELVMITSNKRKTLNYAGLIPFLVNSIKELHTRIEILENKNKGI